MPACSTAMTSVPSPNKACSEAGQAKAGRTTIPRSLFDVPSSARPSIATKPRLRRRGAIPSDDAAQCLDRIRPGHVLIGVLPRNSQNP